MHTPRRSVESASTDFAATSVRHKPQQRRLQRSVQCSRRAVLFICTLLAVGAVAVTCAITMARSSKVSSRPASSTTATAAASGTPSSHLSNISGSAASGGYSARYIGPVASAYGVAGGYWHLEVNHTLPRAPSATKPWAKLGWSKQDGANNSSSTCYQEAVLVEEPYTDFYKPRGRNAEDLPGGVQRAVWQWEGRISRQLFESVPFYVRDYKGCTHCTYVLRYKILGGRLYALAKRRWRQMDWQTYEAEKIEEMLLAALHVFKLPDADFLVHLGDGAPAGLPLLQVNINRAHKQAGFTIPKAMWGHALGPTQLRAYSACLEARYPRDGRRIPRAVWRGSNTDTKLLWPDETNILDLARSRLVLFGRWYPQWLDAQYTAYSQQAFDTDCVERLQPLGSKIKREDFNQYSLILDVDGNGWSDRFRVLSHFNTPILKQASNLTAFFEHVMAPGVAVEHFAPDMHDLPARAAALLAEAAAAPDRLQRTAEQHQGLAHYLLNHMALLEAMAYAVTTVARLSDWTVKEEEGYDLIPFSQCCYHNRALPDEFVRAVRAKGGSAEKQGHQQRQGMQRQRVDGFGGADDDWHAMQRQRMAAQRQRMDGFRGFEDWQTQQMMDIFDQHSRAYNKRRRGAQQAGQARHGDNERQQQQQEQQEQELLRAEQLRRQRLGLPVRLPAGR